MRYLFLRAYRRLARPLGRFLIHRLDRRRLETVIARLDRQSGGRPPVCVVVLPNTLGWLEPCVKLVPPEVPLLLIGNGLGRAERRLVRDLLPQRELVSLSVLPFSFARHGAVLDLLLAASRSDFILLDHDCYVFDSSLFEPIQWKDGEFLAGIRRQGFLTVNQASGLEFPRTHFLVVRREAWSALTGQQGVGCEKRTRTPRSLVTKLAGIGLGDHNFPPARMPFYDTLQLAMATAFAEGRTIRWLTAPPDGISHVGGTGRASNPTQAKSGA